MLLEEERKMKNRDSEITDEDELPEFYKLHPMPIENGQQPSITANDSLVYQSPDSTFPLTLSLVLNMHDTTSFPPNRQKEATREK